MTKFVLRAAFAVIVGGACVMAAPQEPEPTAVFTPAQAEAGRVAYESSCGKCHTAQLTGRKGEAGELPEVSSLPDNMRKTVEAFKGKVPPLVGAPFMDKWGTTKGLTKRIGEAVGGFPPKDKHELSHVELTAYVLSINGARAGKMALTKDTEVSLTALQMKP